MLRFKTEAELNDAHRFPPNGTPLMREYRCSVGIREILIPAWVFGLVCDHSQGFAWGASYVTVRCLAGAAVFSETFTLDEYAQFKAVCLVEETPRAYDAGPRKCTCSWDEVYRNGCKCGGV